MNGSVYGNDSPLPTSARYSLIASKRMNTSGISSSVENTLPIGTQMSGMPIHQ